MPPVLIAGAVAAAGSVAKGVISSNASGKAAKQVAAGNAAAIAEQRRQFDLAKQLLSPYMQGGNAGLQSLLSLSGAGGAAFSPAAYLAQNPDVAAEAQRLVSTGEIQTPEQYAQMHYQKFGQAEGRAAPTGFDAQQQYISQLENSPMFQALARQGEQGILQNASATGGLRGGNVQGALAQFRPAMLNQQIQQQLGQFQNIANMGGNAALGVGNQAIQLGQQIGNLQQNTGQAQAAGTIAKANALGGAISGITNFAGTAFGGGINAGRIAALTPSASAGIMANPGIF